MRFFAQYSSKSSLSFNCHWIDGMSVNFSKANAMISKNKVLCRPENFKKQFTILYSNHIYILLLFGHWILTLQKDCLFYKKSVKAYVFLKKRWTLSLRILISLNYMIRLLDNILLSSLCGNCPLTFNSFINLFSIYLVFVSLLIFSANIC